MHLPSAQLQDPTCTSLCPVIGLHLDLPSSQLQDPTYTCPLPSSSTLPGPALSPAPGPRLYPPTPIPPGPRLHLPSPQLRDLTWTRALPHPNTSGTPPAPALSPTPGSPAPGTLACGRHLGSSEHSVEADDLRNKIQDFVAVDR